MSEPGLIGKRCLGCDHAPLQPIFSLGFMPAVNAFPTAAEVTAERKVPLAIVYCPHCTLVQLETEISPAELFSHYLYMSSTSESHTRHLHDVAEACVRRFGLQTGAHVLEIGSNDGTLLQALQAQGCQVLGIDPAANLAGMARARGVETEIAFFDEASAKALRQRHGSYDLIIALNVVAHTPTFMSMLKGIRSLLKPGGRFWMESVYVVETILQGQFDTIYHEHVCCFSLHSLTAAYSRCGLRAIDVEILPTQGRSLRVMVARDDDEAKVRPSVDALLQREKKAGFALAESYQSAGDKVRHFQQRLRQWIKHQGERGKKVVGLGAPARGVVILNYCSLGPREIAYVTDDTPLKQGRVVPGVHIPVFEWDHLKREPAGAFLLLSWNYREEVLRKLKAYGSRGTLLVPFPNWEEIELT